MAVEDGRGGPDYVSATPQSPDAPGWRARSAGPALEPAALPLRQPAPDAEPLVAGQRVVQAVGADVAAATDPLRLAGRAALLREERLRICLSAQCLLLPGQQDRRFLVVDGEEAQLCHDASSWAWRVTTSRTPSRLRRDLAGAVAPGRGKNTREITRASYRSRQAVWWYCLNRIGRRAWSGGHSPAPIPGPERPPG